MDVSEFEEKYDSVNIDLGITKRQYEIWKRHSRENEDSFEEFWERAKKEKSKTEIAEDFEMSKTTVYSWSDRNE